MNSLQKLYLYLFDYYTFYISSVIMFYYNKELDSFETAWYDLYFPYFISYFFINMNKYSYLHKVNDIFYYKELDYNENEIKILPVIIDLKLIDNNETYDLTNKVNNYNYNVPINILIYNELEKVYSDNMLLDFTIFNKGNMITKNLKIKEIKNNNIYEILNKN